MPFFAKHRYTGALETASDPGSHVPFNVSETVKFAKSASLALTGAMYSTAVTEVVVVVVAGDGAIVGLGGFDVVTPFAALWVTQLQPEASRPRTHDYGRQSKKMSTGQQPGYHGHPCVS